MNRGADFMGHIGNKGTFGEVGFLCLAGHFIQLLNMELLVGVIGYFDEVALNVALFSHGKITEPAFENAVISGIITGFTGTGTKMGYPVTEFLIKKFLFWGNLMIHQETFKLRKIFSGDVIASDVFSMAAERYIAIFAAFLTDVFGINGQIIEICSAEQHK